MDPKVWTAAKVETLIREETTPPALPCAPVAVLEEGGEGPIPLTARQELRAARSSLRQGKHAEALKALMRAERVLSRMEDSPAHAHGTRSANLLLGLVKEAREQRRDKTKAKQRKTKTKK